MLTSSNTHPLDDRNQKTSGTHAAAADGVSGNPDRKGSGDDSFNLVSLSGVSSQKNLEALLQLIKQEFAKQNDVPLPSLLLTGKQGGALREPMMLVAARMQGDPADPVPGKDDGPKGKVKDVVRADDKVAQPKDDVKLSTIPNVERVKSTMLTLLPAFNEGLAKEKAEAAKDKSKPEVTKLPLDKAKIEAEWKQGVWGPESMRAWNETAKFIPDETLRVAKLLDAAGKPLPLGIAIQPRQSETGSGFPEGDALTRARLRDDQLKVDLKIPELKVGQAPSVEDTTSYLNAAGCLGKGSKDLVDVALKNRVDYATFRVKTLQLTEGGLDWKPPANASPEQLQKFAEVALGVTDTASDVRSLAQSIAMMNAATKRKGWDPSFLKWWNDLPQDLGTFKSEALDPKNFPGTCTFNPDGSLKSVDERLPKTLEKPEDVLKAKEEMDAWLVKYGPSAYMALSKFAEGATKDGKALLVAEDDSIEKGKDGSWPKSPKDQKPYNLKRYGFDAEPCDEKGNPNPKGDYVKYSAHEDYLWARCYAYNNWSFLGSVQTAERVVTHPDKIVHKSEPVLIIDDGKPKLVPAEQLQQIAKYQEQSRQVGNYVTAAVDGGMAVTGALEARIAWKAAVKGGEKVMWSFVAKELAKSAWHMGLAGTGFFKRGIEDNFSWGKDFMKYRGYAVMADMTLQITPQAVQSKVWDTAYGAVGLTRPSTLGSIEIMGKWLKTAAAEQKAAAAAKAAGTVAEGGAKAVETTGKVAETAGAAGKALSAEEAAKGLIATFGAPTRLDKALNFAHRLYDFPGVGLFTLADYHYLRDSWIPVGNKVFVKENNIDPVSGALDVPIAKPQDTSHFDSKRLDAEQLKAASQTVLSNYSQYLSVKPSEPNERSLAIEEATKQALRQERGSEARNKYAQELLNIFVSAETRAEKSAAAKGIVDLYKDPEGKLPETLGTTSDAAKTKTTVKGNDVSDYLAHGVDGLVASTQKALGSTDKQEQAKQRDLLVKVFNSSTDGEVRAVAAKGWFALSLDDKGKLPADLADSATAKTMRAALERSGEGLMKKAQEVLFLPAGDKAKEQFAQLAASVFNSANNEKDKTAAAILLLQMRKGNDLAETVGGSAGVSAEDLLKYVKAQAKSTSNDADTRMAAGEALFRLSYPVKLSLGAQGSDIEKLQAEKDKPDNKDATLTVKIADARKQADTTRAFLNAATFDLVDLGQTCTGILRDSKSTKAQKLDAMVSTTGPRLDVIIDAMRNQIEPEIKQLPDGKLRFAEMLRIYGRDADALEKSIRETAANSRENRDVRAVAVQTLLTNAPNANLTEQERSRRFDAMKGAVQEIAKSPDGTFATKFFGAINKDLSIDISKVEGVPAKKAARWEKFEAAVLGKEYGSVVSGTDDTTHTKRVNAALVECVQYNQPDLALKALEQLSPDRIASLDKDTASALSKSAMFILSSGGESREIMALKSAVLGKAQVIFAANVADKEAAATMAECMLIPKMRESMIEKQPGHYPPFAESSPETRLAALTMIATMAPDKGSAVARQLLLGGEFDGKPFAQDVSPDVRLAAANIIVASRPDDLQNVLFQALKKEKDLTILGVLSNAEYKARPELDPVRLRSELAIIQRRMNDRAVPNYLEDGKAELKRQYPKHIDSGFGRNVVVDREVYSDKSKLSRQSIIYAATMNPAPPSACWQSLKMLCAKEGPKLAKELSGPLEMVLQSHPGMDAYTRLMLLDCYMNLKPGENGLVTKDETALLLSNMLQNEIRNMPKPDKKNSLDYKGSIELQEQILRYMQQYPSEKVVACLEALGAGESIKAKDIQQRPAIVQYGDTTRTFSYDRNDLRLEDLMQFKEMPSGKVFKRLSGDSRGNVFACGDERISDVRIDIGYPDSIPATFSYKDSKGVFHRFETNGSETQIVNEKSTVVTPAKPAKDVHSTSEIRLAAAMQTLWLKDTTYLSHLAAKRELDETAQKVKDDSKFKPTCGPTVSTQQLADQMAAVLGNAKNDAKTVCTSLFLFTESKPLEGADDPRLPILVAATKDASERVRLAAAQCLLQSRRQEDIEKGAAVVADTSKNSPNLGLQCEANDVARAKWKEVSAVYEKTKEAPRQSATSGRSEGVDLSYQSAYESMMTDLIKPPHGRMWWASNELATYSARHGAPLLDGHGLQQGISAAQMRNSDQHSLYYRLTTGDKELQRQRDELAQSVTTDMWTQLDNMIAAGIKSDSETDSADLSNFLAWTALEGAPQFVMKPDLRKPMVTKCVDGIHRLATSETKFKGDLEWAVSTLLTQKPDLDRACKDKMVDALDALTVPKGKIQHELAAKIVLVALEQEYRTMPKPDAEGYKASVDLQKKLLDKIGAWGNKEMAPTLEFFSKSSDESLRDAAKKVRDALKR